jgi:hypothetical protein
MLLSILDVAWQDVFFVTTENKDFGTINFKFILNSQIKSKLPWKWIKTTAEIHLNPINRSVSGCLRSLLFCFIPQYRFTSK